MNELDEVWRQDINLAIERAKTANRFSIADYLSLKNSNNAIRKESVDWLINAARDIVFKFNEHAAKIELTQREKHTFKFGKSNLRGQLLKLQQGVRCLEIEAGWTRTPSDGFMRGGALACARIRHFGYSKMDEDLVLLKYEDKPQWFLVADEKKRVSFNIRSFKRHFKVFLG